MKRCPSCDKTYPDSETFCETDGTALVGTDPAFVGATRSGGGIECPVCGGKAEPGEVICNFCGARLTNEPAAAPSATRRTPSEPSSPQPTRLSSSGPGPAQSGYTQRVTSEHEPYEDGGGGGGFLRGLAYVVAALIALGGGAWLALHLTSHQPAQEAKAPAPSQVTSPVAAASPAAPASIGPTVMLASTIPLQVTGESATAPERSSTVMRNAFDAGKPALIDAYSHALTAESDLKDGMMVRLRILPDGTVSKASVMTSTSPNPGLDAEVIKDVSGWTFTPFSGKEVEADYPIIFVNKSGDQAGVETDLSTKVAALTPAEAPEYSAATPSVVSTPAVAAAPSPAATPRHRPRREVAARPRSKPTPSLYERVNDALKANRKFGRVKGYANNSGEVTLTGTVFDDKDKALAMSTARNVPGVTNVIDALSTDTGKWAQEQATIQQQLANAGLPKVTVKVIGRDAYLDGTVKTDLEKQRAVTITQAAAPVVVRGNVITVVPGNMFGF